MGLGWGAAVHYYSLPGMAISPLRWLFIILDHRPLNPEEHGAVVCCHTWDTLLLYIYGRPSWVVLQLSSPSSQNEPSLMALGPPGEVKWRHYYLNTPMDSALPRTAPSVIFPADAPWCIQLQLLNGFQRMVRFWANFYVLSTVHLGNGGHSMR